MLSLFVLVSLCNASTTSIVIPGSQPLGDVDELLESLCAQCGEVLSVNADPTLYAEFEPLYAEFEQCEVAVWSTGFTMRRLLMPAPPRATELSHDQRYSIQREDLALAADLNFDPEEFGQVTTTEVVARDFDDEVGFAAPQYISSKTFIDRAIDGDPVMGSRLVVTRNASGDLTGLYAAWPAFEPGIPLEISDILLSVDDLDEGTFEGTLQSVRSVLIPVISDEGRVSSGVVVSEVAHLVQRTESAILATYWFDGEPFDPIKMEVIR